MVPIRAIPGLHCFDRRSPVLECACSAPNGANRAGDRATGSFAERRTFCIIAWQVRLGLECTPASERAGRLVAINRQRRRLLLSSAAALVSSAGLSALSQAVNAQQPDAASTPKPPSSVTPIFSPKPVWLGSSSFAPTTINLSAPAGAPAEQILPPGVRGRESWNAAPPVQPYVPQTPRGVSLHHTGVYWNGRPGPEQYLRNIQHFHTGPEREWEDIAYHYLVDLDGVIWAGRPPTVRGNPSIYYDPTGLVLVSFLGDFGSQEPSDAQLDSAANASAWLMKRFNMPSTAVTGHRDHAPTTCPGENLYRSLKDGSFAARVRDKLSKLA